jgi:hypothetical protein
MTSPDAVLPPPNPVRHAYPLAVQDAGLGTAFGLLLRTLPYALVRFAILVGCTLLAIGWWFVAVGGAAFLGKRVADWLGIAWLVLCIAAVGSAWKLFVRYSLYVIKCGHIAVLTELITRGQIGDGNRGMFSYGRQVVTERFGEVNVLFAVDALTKGVVNAFNRTLDWVAGLIPLPGLDSAVHLVQAVIRAATSYIDETLFSYGLARGDANPWRSAQDGLIYYCQCSKEVLKTAVWVVVLDKVLTGVAWVVFLLPGFALASLTSSSSASLLALGAGFLFALSFRSAFLKPLFLIMVMVKFHVAVRGMAIDATWDARLTTLSDKFREIGAKAKEWMGRRPAPQAGAASA